MRLSRSSEYSVMRSRAAINCLTLLLAPLLSSSAVPTSAAHSLLVFHRLSKEPPFEPLTHIQSCPDPSFKCETPPKIPVPGEQGICQPYDPRVFSIKGSFKVDWSDTPSLPTGTGVAVCTSVQFWAQSHCRGARFTVSMPNAATFRLYIRRDVSKSGELLNLGSTGPLRSRFPVRSISCANASSWRTTDEPEPAAEAIAVQSEEITRAIMGQGEGIKGHRVSLNLSLLLASVLAMAVFAVFGAAFAFIFKDSLSGLVIEESEDPSSARATQAAVQKEAWFDPNCHDWEGGKTITCEQQSSSSMQGRLLAAVAAALPRRLSS